MSNKLPFILISFYTDNWEYPRLAESLKDDCERLDIDYDIEKLSDQGSWIKNTRLKSNYVYDKLIEHKKPVLWIDVDSKILKIPDLINPVCDFAAVKHKRSKIRTFYASTLFFNYTENGISFAKRWAGCQAEGSDHLALEEIWQEGFEGLIQVLPESYCKIDSEINLNNESTVIVYGSSKDNSKKDYFKSQKTGRRNQRLKKTISRNRKKRRLSRI